MSLQFHRAGDVDSRDLYYKILLYGDSGAGKTWMAASAGDNYAEKVDDDHGVGRCVIGLTERNGEQSIRHANPDARYALLRSAQDVRDFLKMASTGSFPDDVTTLVIDGLTEVQQLFKDDIMAERGDGEFSVRDWGLLNEKMRGLLRMLRDLPYHVVCTALSETSTAEEIHYIQPSFQGRKMGGEAMQYFNAVGYVFKKPGRGKDPSVEHVAMFDGPARIQAKNSHPLDGVRRGPVRDWIRLLRGDVTDGNEDTTEGEE
jgi:hypothetical protein